MDNFIAWIKAHSGLLLVVVTGLLVGIIFLRKQPPASSNTSTAGMSGLQRDANGNPIVYRDVADEFVNVVKDSYNGTPVVSSNPTQPGPSATPGIPATPSSPGEHPIEPYPTDPNPYAGLLGPNVAVNFTNRTYKNAQGQDTPLPIPASDQLSQGDQGRVWYVDSGIQHLLTDGTGPPVTNSGYPVNSPENTPGAYSGSTQSSSSTTSGGGTTNQQNSQTTITKNTGGQS